MTIEGVSLLVAGGLSAVIAVADMFGLLDRFPWIQRRVPLLTLLLIGVLVGGYGATRDTVSRINADLAMFRKETLSRLGGGVEAIQFADVAEVYRYAAGRIRSATVSVDDITWGSRKNFKTENEKQAYSDYLAAMKEACAKGTLAYREISNLVDQHYFGRAKAMVDGGYSTYHLGYHDTLHNDVPMMSYMIIDRTEVVVGFLRAPTFSPAEKVFLSIKDPQIVEFFKGHYDELWDKSKKMKEGDTIDRKSLAEIEQRLSDPGEAS